MSSFSACWRQASRKGQLGQCLFRTTGGGSPAGSPVQTCNASTIFRTSLYFAGQLHLGGAVAQPDQGARGWRLALHLAEDEPAIGKSDGVGPGRPASADHLHRLVAVPPQPRWLVHFRKEVTSGLEPVGSQFRVGEHAPARGQVALAAERNDLACPSQAESVSLTVGLRLLPDDQFVVVRAGACRCPRHQQERLPGTEGIRLDKVGSDGSGHGLLALRVLRGGSASTGPRG